MLELLIGNACNFNVLNYTDYRVLKIVVLLLNEGGCVIVLVTLVVCSWIIINVTFYFGTCHFLYRVVLGCLIQ